jgi:hypothetical protein
LPPGSLFPPRSTKSRRFLFPCARLCLGRLLWLSRTGNRGAARARPVPRLGILRTSNLGTDENAISSEEGCGWCREELAVGPSAAGSTQLIADIARCRRPLPGSCNPPSRLLSATKRSFSLVAARRRQSLVNGFLEGFVRCECEGSEG